MEAYDWIVILGTNATDALMTSLNITLEPELDAQVVDEVDKSISRTLRNSNEFFSIAQMGSGDAIEITDSLQGSNSEFSALFHKSETTETPGGVRRRFSGNMRLVSSVLTEDVMTPVKRHYYQQNTSSVASAAENFRKGVVNALLFRTINP
jgi:hypothetical protein